MNRIYLKYKFLGHWLETSKGDNRNLVPSPKYEKSFIVPVRSKLQTKNKHFWNVRGKAIFGHISHMCTN